MTGYNLKSPAVKRLMREAQELSKPTELYYAQPLEDNLFEWHFTIRGPEGSEFEGGIYHGQISLPTEYPMKPPNIMLLTPNGRFEQYRQICLSISGYHPETWCPSWSIRTALLAIIGFMPTSGAGAIGSMSVPMEERKKLAVSSNNYVCDICGPTKDLLLPLTSASNSTVQEAKEVASQFILTDPSATKTENSTLKPHSSETPEGPRVVIESPQTISKSPDSNLQQSAVLGVNGSINNAKPVYWLCYPVYSMTGITNGSLPGASTASSAANNSATPPATAKKDPPLSFENWLKQVHPSSSDVSGTTASLQSSATISQPNSSKAMPEDSKMWKKESQVNDRKEVDSKIVENKLQSDKENATDKSIAGTPTKTAESCEHPFKEVNSPIEKVNEPSDGNEEATSQPLPNESEVEKSGTSETKPLDLEASKQLARQLLQEATERHRQRAQRMMALYGDTDENPNSTMLERIRSERALMWLILTVTVALIALVIRRIMIMSTTGPD